MDWLEYFKLGGPMSTGTAFFLVWFLGVVAGYCFGRAHAACLRMDSLIDSVADSVSKLGKGHK